MSADINSVSKEDPRRHIASVSKVLSLPKIIELSQKYSPAQTTETIQEILGELRHSVENGESPDISLSRIVERVSEKLRNIEHDRLQAVVNATGILLHTGLGRAVLPQKAVAAMARLNRCCNLQIDLETGLRGKRDFMSSNLIRKLTGAEMSVLTNNNAAATLLILAALAPGKEVIISRGQLIEIGGSFRLPDCIMQSGAKMVEVGTTNKTHLRDYEQAINEHTALILKVNPSNYRITGFTQDVSIQELVSLKNKYPITVVDDLGCGALIDLSAFGLPKEPMVQDSIAAGADVVCFSGDKLIGGPQCGIIAGSKEVVSKIKKHPLSRMLRVCKLTSLALEQTLRLFTDPTTLIQNNPTLRMLTVPLPELKKKAERIVASIKVSGTDLKFGIVPSESETGGGSLPGCLIPSYAISLQSTRYSTNQLSKKLRDFEPPIIARITRNEVLLDIRTLMEGDEETIKVCLENL